MPASLTLTDIPDALYERLNAAAALHHRSLNSEAIACLEAALLPNRAVPSDRLNRASELRSRLVGGRFAAQEIDALKRAGRE